MRHFPALAVEAGLATALLVTAGCSASSSHDNQPSTVGTPSIAPSTQPVTPETTAPVSSALAPSTPASSPSSSAGPKMSLAYEFAPGASEDLARVQVPVGYAAVQSVLSAPFAVTIDGKTRSVSVRIPEDPSARKQEVIFAANSSQAGSIFSQLGLKNLANDTRSVTAYGVKAGPNGELQQDGLSVSVVGQETDGIGLFQNIATERCQALEVVAKPAITARGLYAAVKEAICNATGAAADSKQLDQSYATYKKRAGTDFKLGSDVNHGYDITYPALSAAQYAILAGKQ